MRATKIDKAIEVLEMEIKIRQHAIEALRTQQAKPKIHVVKPTKSEKPA